MVTVGGRGVVFGVVGAGDEVEAVLDAASGERDVAGFLVEGVVAEHEGFVDGETLGLVDGGGVRVADMAGVEILGRAASCRHPGAADRDRSRVGVDAR